MVPACSYALNANRESTCHHHSAGDVVRHVHPEPGLVLVAGQTCVAAYDGYGTRTQQCP